MKIPVDKIIVSKDNPRQSFDEEGLRRLGESIKTHGQLQRGIVRPKGSFYELVVGERRLRACALVGINEFEADVMDVDDATVMELRLIENCHREDLTDAEKGDAVLHLWSDYDKYENFNDVAKAIGFELPTVERWLWTSKYLSPKLRQLISSNEELTNRKIRALVKYSHGKQEALAKVIISKKIPTTKVYEFTKLYDANPNADLNELADEVLGLKKIEIPESILTEEQLKKLEEKKQLAKVQRIRKKWSRPLTKDEVKKKLAKKTDFKFDKVRVTTGNKGSAPPLKREIKPLATPIPETPDYSLCKCALCSLFAKHCKGRCWT